jgi:hypothetical protein
MLVSEPTGGHAPRPRRPSTVDARLARDDFGATWSPDGSQIAFVRNLGGGGRCVWIVR